MRHTAKLRLGRDITEVSASDVIDITQAILTRTLETGTSKVSHNELSEMEYIGERVRDAFDIQQRQRDLARMSKEDFKAEDDKKDDEDE